MPTHRVLKGVLCNFLGTYTSRYSDYEGYWLFGLAVGDLPGADLDLLVWDSGGSRNALQLAHELATRQFADQLRKSGLDRSRVVDARLHVEQSSAGTDSLHREGWTLRFLATATADTGRRFACEKIVFVAPHDPSIEGRSDRRDRRLLTLLHLRPRRARGSLDE